MLPLRILLFVVALLIIGLSTFLLYARLVRDTTTRPLWRGIGASLLAAPFFCAPLLRVVVGRGVFAREAAAVVMTWWGVLLFALLALVVIEVARRARPAPTDPGRRELLARASALGAVGFGGSMGAFGVYRAMADPHVTELSVRLPNLPKALEGLTLVQLSDLHIGPVIQERFVDRLVERANGLQPDLVVITGDLVDGSPDRLGRFVARLARLQSRFGTFVVSGNHDYYSGWEQWVPVHERLGFTLLRNRRVSVGDSAASLDLVGVEDWGNHFGGNSAYDLDAALTGRDPSRASVLLAHQPVNLDAVRDAGIGLQLSGHTHGGQIFPATLIAQANWGAATAGLSSHGSLQQFTSRGCGFVGPPMRVGSPPEVVKLVLLPA